MSGFDRSGYPYPGGNVPQPSNGAQIVNGGFVSVPNENMIVTWPVAPGNSVTFKIENAPYIYTKTRGFSPFDQPIIEKYRLVKEDLTSSALQQPQEKYALEKDVMTLIEAYKRLETEVKALKGNPVQDELSVISQEVSYEQNT